AHRAAAVEGWLKPMYYSRSPCSGTGFLFCAYGRLPAPRAIRSPRRVGSTGIAERETEVDMSLDRSLKSANALVRHRNVLTRDERIEKLKEEEKWQAGRSVFGLPKVAHRKMAVGGKGGEKAEAAAEGTPVAAGG